MGSEMKPELLACPFCGGQPVVSDYREVEDETGEITGYAAVECHCLGADGGVFFHCDTLGAAVAAWNRRSEPRGDSPLAPEGAPQLASGGNREPEPSSAALAWRPITETPRPYQRIIAPYNDGSGAVLYIWTGEQTFDADGDEHAWADLEDHHDRWAALPSGVRLWCERWDAEPMQFPDAPDDVANNVWAAMIASAPKAEVEGVAEAWRAAEQRRRDAISAYSERLAVVRAERDRGNWGCKADAEYQAMEDARKAEYAPREALFAALPAPPTRDGADKPVEGE